MLFNSFDFAIFLPLVFLGYWLVFQRNLRMQNLFIVVVSYLFYGWWDWRFLLLIALTTGCSWASGLLIEKYRDKRWRGRRIDRMVSAANIVLNIGILFFFKYYNFFVDSFVEAFSLMGQKINMRTLDIILPVGISFYTFQALSYSIDVYRRKIVATRDVVSFFAFVSFFPQLVAGPIERATHLLPQFYVKRHFDARVAADGCKQMLWGFFKKMVVGDTCAMVADSTFGNMGGLSGSTLLLGAFFFSFQIYCDFSGYSDIAIGCSKLFGFRLMKNFDRPYFSRNISEFWKRWHISLQRWFIDYIYIPLGGSREGISRTLKNILIVFAISGLWHGANWTYVVWGLYHAMLLMLLTLLVKNRKFENVVAAGKRIPTIRETVQMVSTFVLAVLGWIFFRATSIGHAVEYFRGIFNDSLFTIPKFVGYINANALLSLAFIGILVALDWVSREREHPLTANNWKSLIVAVVLLGCIYFFGVDSSSFIYFQF